MSETAKCPVCQGQLSSADSLYRCDECGSDYEAQAVCDCCGDPLAVLKANGIAECFCNHCNEAKSKTQVRYRYLTVSHELIT